METIGKVAECERPRERLLACGAAALTDRELVAILVGSGVRGRSAYQIAGELLERHGDLRHLFAAGPTQLMAVAGLGPARSAILLAAGEAASRVLTDTPANPVRLGSPADVALYFRPRLCAQPQEVFCVCLLDARLRLKSAHKVAVGTLEAASVHPRDVFRPAISESAASVLLVHNHPSGDPSPSPEDVEVTRRLQETGELLGIPVIDHVIVAAGGYVSLQEAGVVGEARRFARRLDP